VYKYVRVWYNRSMDEGLLDRLIDAYDQLMEKIRDLAKDPALEGNSHWRENLAQTGYQIETLLADDTD
jgi:hypothetical protein